MSAQVTVKGSSPRGMQLWCRERFGEKEFAKLLAAKFSPEVRQSFEADLLTSRDYPAQLQNDFLAQLAAHFGPSGEQELRVMGAWCARRDLGGIYRIFLMLFSTLRSLEAFVGLWRRYQNTGEAVLTRQEPGLAVLEIRDEHNTIQHSWLVGGYVHAVLELTGAKSVKVDCDHPRGSAVATLSASWK